MILSLARLKKDHPLVKDEGTILLIGATGQIGERIRPLLKDLYPGKVISIGRKADPKKHIFELDFTDTPKLLSFIQRNHVKVVVNMAAVLSGKAEEDAQADKVNFEAVKQLIEGSKDLGVKQIFTPSSIAVYGPEDTKDTARYATLATPTTPTGNYGKAKVKLENFMREWNAKGEGAFATGMRIGGVLSCKMPPPSAGTAMEFDKILVAAAYEKAHRGKRCPELVEQGYYQEDGYHPKIPKDAKMPFILVDDAAREIVRYLHTANREDCKARREDPNATRHHLSSFVMDMDELRKFVLRKNPAFRMKFGPESESKDNARARFTREWPASIDNSLSKKWGFGTDPLADMGQSLEKTYQRVLDSQKKTGWAPSKKHGS